MRTSCLLLFAVAGFIFTGCQSPSPVKNTVAGADSVAIRLFADSTSFFSTKDKSTIAIFTRFVSGKEVKRPTECNFQPKGHMEFFAGGKLLNLTAFNNEPQPCALFLTNINGKGVFTKVDKDAMDFLKTLQTKQTLP